MPDETPPRPAETTPGRGHPGGGAGEQSPLQARAKFLEDRRWDAVIGFNRGACARGGAQHGVNPEAGGAVEAEWNRWRDTESTFLEVIGFLRWCHRAAPFLFFNGNTFADIGRRIAAAVFGDLPPGRQRALTSAVAHHIAGLLDEKEMSSIVESLCRGASWVVGDRVKTMRGSVRGVIVRVLEDGRVAVRPDGSTSELLSLPESLLPDD